MNIRKQFRLTLVLFCASTYLSPRASADAPDTSQTERVYVDSLGTTHDAIYLCEKLVLRLQKAHQVVVSHRQGADMVVLGSARMQVVGYINLNPRVRRCNTVCSTVYDARMPLELEDSNGQLLWSGTLKPRFWARNTFPITS